MINIKFEQKVNIVIAIAIGIFFFFFLGEKGYIVERDSHIYMNFTTGKELTPIYATFLLLCKTIWGEKLYLVGVYLLQGLLAIITSLYLSITIRKMYHTTKYETFLFYILSFLPYAWTLPEYVCTHSIFTEGLTFPIFYVFFVCILKAIVKESILEANKSLFWIIILTLTRLQLGFLFIFYIIAIMYILLRRFGNKLRKSVYGYIIVLSVIGICTIVFNATGTVDVLKTHLSNLIFGKAMYVADEVDVDLFEDENIRDIFNETYKKIDQEKLLYKYSRQGLWRWKDLKSSIKINEIAYEIIEKNIGNSTITEVRQKIALPLLFDNLGRYISVLLQLLPESLMCAIFIQKPSFYLLCYFITLFLYFSLIFLDVYGAKNQKVRKEVIIFVALVLAILTLNILVSNVVMFGLQRYLVYTYGLFYMGFYLIMKELFGEKFIQMITKGKKKQNEEVANYNTSLQ